MKFVVVVGFVIENNVLLIILVLIVFLQLLLIGNFLFNSVFGLLQIQQFEDDIVVDKGQLNVFDKKKDGLKGGRGSKLIVVFNKVLDGKFKLQIFEFE